MCGDMSRYRRPKYTVKVAKTAGSVMLAGSQLVSSASLFAQVFVQPHGDEMILSTTKKQREIPRFPLRRDTTAKSMHLQKPS